MRAKNRDRAITIAVQHKAQIGRILWQGRAYGERIRYVSDNGHLILHCHWRGTFTLQSRIGMSARTDCTRWVQAISCSGRVSMMSPL